VPGFGHRFHPRDPRRDPLLALTQAAVSRGTVAGHHLRIGELIESRLSAGRTKPVPMNIDGVTAIVYGELGFSPPLVAGYSSCLDLSASSPTSGKSSRPAHG
jgi:citrate synthase